jgi:GNAT superfamily N-acetyltransferase
MIKLCVYRISDIVCKKTGSIIHKSRYITLCLSIHSRHNFVIMSIQIQKTDFNTIAQLRQLFLQEANFQVRYDAYHARNWADYYVAQVGHQPIGYAAVKGIEERNDRNSVFEFYLIPSYRQQVAAIFSAFVAESKVHWIESQSNDGPLTALLYEFGKNISSEVILFKDLISADLAIENVHFRPIRDSDQVFEHTSEPVGHYVLEKDGQIVATGGYLTHYNFPFADLYMEVHPQHRRKGYGSLLLQEIKKVCYHAGRVPAARCNRENKASKATLLKAGFAVAGYLLVGELS